MNTAKAATIFCAVCFTLGTAKAATITVTDALAAGDTANYHWNSAGVTTSGSRYVNLKLDSGNTIANGMVWRVGFITGYSSELDTTLRALSTPEDLLKSNATNKFVPLGISGGGTGDENSANMVTKALGGSDGRMGTNIANVTYQTGTANAEVAGGVARGTRLFLLVFNQNVVTPDSGEWGLFSADTWLIPTTGTAATLVELKRVDTSAEVFHGSLGSLKLGAPIPEPSTSLMALLAGMGLIARRRR